MEINSIAKISNTGKCYSTYTRFFEEQDLELEGLSYSPGSFKEGTNVEILYIGAHNLSTSDLIAVVLKINTCDVTLIGLDGLTSINISPVRDRPKISLRRISKTY